MTRALRTLIQLRLGHTDQQLPQSRLKISSGLWKEYADPSQLRHGQVPEVC